MANETQLIAKNCLMSDLMKFCASHRKLANEIIRLEISNSNIAETKQIKLPNTLALVFPNLMYLKMLHAQDILMDQNQKWPPKLVYLSIYNSKMDKLPAFKNCASLQTLIIDR